MRTSLVGFGLATLVVGWATSAAAQGAFTDARRAGMAGLSLGRESGLERYNPAYRAVPARVTQRIAYTFAGRTAAIIPARKAVGPARRSRVGHVVVEG